MVKNTQPTLREDKYRKENILTSGDFEKIEKKEKGRILHKIFLKKRPQEKKVEEGKIKTIEEVRKVADLPAISKMLQEQRDSINQLSIVVEKLGGKFELELELEEDSKKDINERISDLAEKIGELRSTVLERERFFDKMEVEFESIRDTVHDIKPERIQKQFEEKEKVMLKNQADIEKAKHLAENLNNEIKEYREIMNKIKSFENLIKTLNEIDEKVKLIEKTKQYTEQMTSKVETLFFELNKKLTLLTTHSDKIAFLEELTNDFVKSMDKNAMKIEKNVTKDELEEKFKKINKDMSILKDLMFDKELNSFEVNVEEGEEGNKERSDPSFDELYNLIEEERSFIRSNELAKARETHFNLMEIYKNIESKDLKKRVLKDWSKIKDDMELIGIKPQL